MTGTPTETIANELHSAAIRLLRRVRDVDEATGLSAARLSLLSYLVFAGPASVSELARSEQVTPASVSQLVNGMQDDGLVERMENPHDLRVTLVCATTKGEKILLDGQRARVELLTRLLAPLTASELETLSQAAQLIERSMRS